MNTKPRLSIDDPAIKQAFAGIFKSSAKVFFRVTPDGTHQQIPVFKALDGITATHDNKTQLIASFPFEHRIFCSERMKSAAAAEANRKLKPVTVAADADEDEIGDEEAAGTSKKNPEYFLVTQNNGYFGCFSAREGNTVAMFKTEPEATAYIRQLLQGASHVRGFYGSKVKAD